MKRLQSWGLATVASLVLAACGGGGDGDQSPRVHYTATVSFGDSLSDVGTYATTGLVAAAGGAGNAGKYSVNSSTGKNWTELIAVQAGTGAPCAAQTGLQSTGPLAAFAQATANHAGCYGYAQGGSRVTNPVGPGNQAVIALGDTGGYLGQLTDPVVNQISRHLTAVGGSFSGTELVTVLAGGNDVFMNLAAVSGGAMTPTQAVTAMGVAGDQLATLIKTQIIGKGAKYVVSVNLPDVSQTPFAYSQSASTQGLINAMSVAFNTALKSGLGTTAGVLQVDAYTQGQDQVAHPAQYGITNNTGMACDLTKTLLATSLVCNNFTLAAGDVSHYAFADSVHPTPYGYKLLAQYVTQRMVESGWL